MRVGQNTMMQRIAKITASSVQMQRGFSTTRTAAKALTVGYVPEHFSTPIFFAKNEGFYRDAGIEPEFVPYVSGTGHMIEALKAKDIDVAIGLTEGFVAGLGKGQDWFKIVGTYVQSPLCWAISTGINRADVTSVKDLQGGRIGISRIGSGSYVMPFVLAQQEGWKESFDFKILTNFKNLRVSVNDSSSDAFMWELFTSKRYYDTKEIKYVGKIFTPWPSWTITASSATVEAEAEKGSLAKFFGALNKGIGHFRANPEQAVEYIATNLDYTAEDARAWMETVQFVDDVAQVDEDAIVKRTVNILRQAGVITSNVLDTASFVHAVKSA
ncbi:uncharacterized protein V1518DRAFT_411219 [Limtongia smithiae]|uniref:uncharacterized protein n=1 Tax=Limtongia smithiae TaxID=1125753 RepID=UPI0034CF9081